MSVKTISLTGTETAVTGLNGANAAIRNDSTDVIYVSSKPGITPGADGVLSILSGGSAVLQGISGAVYLTGTGSVMMITSDYNENPFKSAPAAAAGGGVSQEYVDGQDAAMLNSAKTYSDALFSGVTSFNAVIVDNLPDENIDPHTIYFVPKTADGSNNYDEFMYINDAWEHIGSTDVDLSGYYTKSETNAALAGKSDTSHTHTIVNGHTVNSDVPANAKFTDTVYTHPAYTARTGVPTANQTPAFGGTFQVTQPVSDTSGHITTMNSRSVTIPATAASASAAGLVSTGAQTLAGNKTFNGSVICSGASVLTTAQARNIYAGTDDLTAGTSALATGAIYICYE